MKNLSKFLVLIIGLSAFTTLAQKADSVIVIYDNQKTVIPLPAFGRQTSVSYADTNKVVEIGVWIRKPGETSPFSQLYATDVSSGKSNKQSKWLSQVEAGYLKGFNSSSGVYSTTGPFYGEPPVTTTDTFSTTDRRGYQLKLSILEGEFYLNKNSSIISGFKLGFSQSFIQAHSYGNVTDSAGNVLRSFNDNYKFKINSFQFLYQFGYSFHTFAGKLPARINVGNSMGIMRTMANTNDTRGAYGGVLYASLLQPYIGFEIWKVGLLFSADCALPNNHYYIMHNNLGGNFCIALSYRIF